MSHLLHPPPPPPSSLSTAAYVFWTPTKPPSHMHILENSQLWQKFEQWWGKNPLIWTLSPIYMGVVWHLESGIEENGPQLFKYGERVGLLKEMYVVTSNINLTLKAPHIPEMQAYISSCLSIHMNMIKIWDPLRIGYALWTCVSVMKPSCKELQYLSQWTFWWAQR